MFNVMRRKPYRLRFSAALFAIALLPQWAGADITISDESGLRAFAAAVNDGSRDYEGENVCLANDIALSAGGVWTPIGTPDHPFRGHFEGWGHKISNMTVSGGDYVGLFGYVEAGSIRDVAVITGSINTTGSYAGALCGYVASSGEISSCYSEISVSGTQYVGGICGYFAGYEIKDCYSTGNVEAVRGSVAGQGEATSLAPYIGGIVGQVYGGDVRRCYYTGRIDYSSNYGYYGSIVGDVKSGQEGIDIENCVYMDYEYAPKAIGCGVDEEESPTDGQNHRATAAEMQTASCWTGELNTETYNTAWRIADGSYPQLCSFIKNEPITFSFTSDKQWLTIVPNGNYAVPAGMTAYIVTNVEDNTVTLRSVGTLNEGRAALVWSDGGESITVSSTAGALSDYSADRWLKGSHVSPVVLKGDRTEYVLSGGIFQRSRSGTLARGKAYLKVPAGSSGSNRLEVIIDDDPTGVVSQESRGESEAATFYDLSGRKVSGRPAKGRIYIKNGKKIIIR